MADITIDGKVKVWLVPTIANIAAPTTAELNAGQSIAGQLTADGLVGFQPDTQAVDTTALNSTYGTKRPGSADIDGTILRFKQQYPTDTIKTLLAYEYATHVVIRRDGTTETTAWASTNKVEVWPVTCGYRRDVDPVRNEVQKYEIPVFVSPQPNQNATVA